MSDEPTPEDEVHEVEQEAPVEVKSSKKSKADKKKPIAHTQPKEDQAVAKAAAEPSGAIETPQAAEMPAVVSNVEAVPAARAAAKDGAPADRKDDLFQQGVQSLLHGEYDAADNCFGQALTNYRKQGDQTGQIAVLEQLGHLCYLRGAEAQAREYYQQAGLMRAV